MSFPARKAVLTKAWEAAGSLLGRFVTSCANRVLVLAADEGFGHLANQFAPWCGLLPNPNDC